MRTPTRAALLALCLTLPVLSACARDASPTPGASSGPSRGTYVVGADPDDDPCARVVSALGFADLLLLPAGQEDRQTFDDAVRSRLAYVEGVVLQYGSRLPREVLAQEAVLRRTTRGLAPAATPHEKQVRLLAEYRAAEKAVRAACP